MYLLMYLLTTDGPVRAAPCSALHAVAELVPNDATSPGLYA
jgi:hypothetical protein